MAERTIDIDDLLETNDDPRFITSIFNYCHRRCERCPFTDRCRLYADEQHDLLEHPGEHWTDSVRRSFEQTMELLKRWCEHEGIDFAKIQQEADSPEVTAELERIEATRRDPLQQLAEQYTFTALRLADTFRAADGFGDWSDEARDALATIEWFAARVASKIHRALGGYASRAEEGDDDPVQSDWNGSAKVARLDIAESRAAWDLILRIGKAADTSPLRRIIDLIDEIDAGVAARFPQAMAFVRPGFDQPEQCVPSAMSSH